MYFLDRSDAAERLAEKLADYRGHNPLILAIPRGAVPMGRILAERLAGDLDVILVRKLGAPSNPELAIGAVAESGWFEIADYAVDTGADKEYLKHELATQQAKIGKRRELLRSIVQLDPKGRVAIVVDDGLATGNTMVAALRAVRDRGPKRLICAVPVASPDALQRVRILADEIVCLYCPMVFNAVGQFYRHFPQVEDAEVLACLSGSRKQNSNELA